MNESEKKEIQVDYKFKVVLVGDTNTGKSTLLSRLIDKNTFIFNNNNNTNTNTNNNQTTDMNNNGIILNTVGVDFKSEIFQLDKSNVRVLLNFYDTSGAEQYRSIAQSYCTENVCAFIITYDVKNLNSFLNCQYWLDEITKRHKCNNNYNNNEKQENNKKKKVVKKLTKCDHLIKILVGCKNDSAGDNQQPVVVSTKKAKSFAKKNGFCLFFETSAKDNLNIRELFEEVSMELISNYIKYLNSLETTMSMVSVPCTNNNNNNNITSTTTNNNNLMPYHQIIPVRALSSMSDVYYNVKTEQLNCNHIILNNKNSKRKNLQCKGLLDFF
jgi:small GTP-binding protein